RAPWRVRAVRGRGLAAGGFPGRALPQVDAGDGGPLAQEQRAGLVFPEEAAEGRVVIARAAAEHRFEVAVEHAEPPDDVGGTGHAEEGRGAHVQEARAHVVLPGPVALAAGPDALVARAHGAQVGESQFRVVVALGDPPEHAAAVAVDAVPHHGPDEAPDLGEAVGPVELGHADGHLVAAGLADQASGLRVRVVRLAGAGADAGVLPHA